MKKPDVIQISEDQAMIMMQNSYFSLHNDSYGREERCKNAISILREKGFIKKSALAEYKEYYKIFEKHGDINVYHIHEFKMKESFKSKLKKFTIFAFTGIIIIYIFSMTLITFLFNIGRW